MVSSPSMRSHHNPLEETMYKLTLWSIFAVLLLALAGCSKDEPTPVGPVTSDQQVQKKGEASPISYWSESDIAEWATAEPYIKTYPPPAKKGRLGKTLADPPIVTNGGFEDGFSGWTTFVTPPGLLDFRVPTRDPHPEWAWIVAAVDPFGTNTTMYPFGMLHPEPLARPGSDGAVGASAVENVGAIVHRLYQTITLPPTGTLTLEFYIRWKNRYAGTPKWFNQFQDIIVSFRDASIAPGGDATSDPYLANGILFKAFAINPAPFSGDGGNITTAFYERKTVDVTAFAGQTVRLDFEIDARGGPLFVDLDDIAIVQVITNHPPVANAGLDQTINCVGPSGAAVNLDGTGSSDLDAADVLTYTWTGPFGTASGATPTVALGGGVHTITLTVDDGKGGTATDEVIVTVNLDVTAPTVTLNGPSSITLECPGPYNEQGATVTDECDLALSASITGSVDVHKVGTYTLTYAATDAAGNPSAPVTRTVNMVDTTPPVITLSGDAEITLECPAAYNEPGAVVTDNCEPPPTLVISGSVNSHMPGTYTITYTATDANGLTSTTTRTVRIVDTTPPTITLNGANPMTLECPTPYVELGAVASDACDPSPSLVITGSVDAHTLGSYTIRYTATDASNNTSFVERTVNVVDTTPPSITLKGANPMVLECPATYNEPGAVVTDACDPSPTLTIEGPVDGGALGTYTVNYTVSDHSGNATVATRTVIVRDTKAPLFFSFVTTHLLWPPNHNLVNVGLKIKVQDACDPDPTITVKVYSDEDDVDAQTGDDHSPDAADIGVGTLRLRAERSDKKYGRVYLIVLKATDESGNSSYAYSAVVVPKAQNLASIALVTAQAVAARLSAHPDGSRFTPYLVGDGPVIGPKQ